MKQASLFAMEEKDSLSSNRTSARSGTFTDNMKLPIHRWFRYSAGFSSEWAVDVLREYGEKRKLIVLDPFAGSGTTLLAAEQVGFKSYGFESHPFIYRAAHAKLLWYSDIKSFLNKTKIVLKQAEQNIKPLPDENSPLLIKYYTPETLRELFSLRNTYFELRNDSDHEWELICSSHHLC